MEIDGRHRRRLEKCLPIDFRDFPQHARPIGLDGFLKLGAQLGLLVGRSKIADILEQKVEVDVAVPIGFA